MMKSPWSRLLLLPLLVLALGAAGCSDDDDDNPTAPAADAQLRVAHLSPDAPNVDVWLDGERVSALTNVPYQTVSAYLEVPAGTHRVQVTPHGAETPVVIDETVDLAPDRAYTAAATGLLAEIALRSWGDDRMPEEGQAKVRFIHASPDAPAVDVTVADGGPTLFTAVAFGEVGGYAAVAPATYDLEVLLASNKAQALAVPGVSLAGGTNYTIFAIGLAGDGSLAALPVVDTP